MKFKNIKEKKENTKSPSNSRTNPERFESLVSKINLIKLLKLYREILKVFVILIFIIAVIIVGIDFQNNLQTKRRIDSQREALTKYLNFWEGFISKHKNYRDAYFQASILEYKLGNTVKAKMYVEKGLSLDPSSINGEKIKQFLVNK
jgi:tetratricopeptide (TPR) repeat protein